MRHKMSFSLLLILVIFILTNFSQIVAKNKPGGEKLESSQIQLIMNNSTEKIDIENIHTLIDNTKSYKILSTDTVSIEPGDSLTQQKTHNVPFTPTSIVFIDEFTFPIIVEVKNDTSIINGNEVTNIFTLYLKESATIGQFYYKSFKYMYLAGNQSHIVQEKYYVYAKGDAAPNADFSASPTSGTAPLTVQFTDLSTGNITSRLWNFGDGQTSAATNPSHIYQNAGTFAVQLTVTGSGGSNTKTLTNYITVYPAHLESNFIEVASDSPQDVLKSKPRDVYAGCDLDRDGKKEIIVTDYSDGGKIHIFEVIGNNTIELVWSSNGTSSQYEYPSRCVKIGDLDNNGLKEILVPIARTNNSSDHGLHVFEWDGTNDNGYGNGSPISVCPVVKDWDSGYTETIAVDDIDNDSKQEVVYISEGSENNDGVFIISCNGNFSSGNVTWVEEASFKRADGYFSGAPFSSAIGDLDNDGKKEAIIGVWDDGAFLILEATGANNYTQRSYFRTTPGTDDICLKNIILTDFDKDGKNDILFTLSTQEKMGLIYNISNLETLNSNPQIKFIVKDEIKAGFGMAYGDQDNDGENNLFITQYRNGGILNIQYKGTGDRLSSDNYNIGQLFIDESGNANGSFAIAAPSVDLDGDGLKEIVVTFIDGDEDPNKKWFRVFEHDGQNVSVNKWEIVVPGDYKLFQNYPNPFNDGTKIEFEIPVKKNISLEIYDISGRLVNTLISNEEFEAGLHGIYWNGKNEKGQNVSTGVYIYRLRFGNFSVSKRMSYIR